MQKLYHKTLRLTGTYALGNLFRRGVQVVLIPLYTAYLATDQYGALAMLNVAIAFLALLIETPLVSGALERFYYHPRYAERSGQLLFNVFLLLLVQTVAIAVGYMALSGLVNRVLFHDDALLPLVRLYALILILWPMWALMLSLMKLREMAAYYVAACTVGMLLAAGVAVVGLTVFHMGVYAVALGQIVEYGVVTLMGLPVFLQHAEFRLSAGILTEPLRFGYPLLPTGMTRLGMRLLDQNILCWFRGLSAVGVYAFGYGIAEGVDSMVVQPLVNGVAPTVRQLEDTPDQQRQFVRHAATMYYLVAVFVGLLASLAAPELVRILGRSPGYWAAQAVIPIIALAFVQQSLGLFADWGLVMRNKSYHLTGILLVAAVVNVGLDLLLVPLWGFVGVALAMLAGCVTWNALKMYFSAKLYDLHFDHRRLLHATALGVGLYLLSLSLAGANLAWSLAGKAALAGAFPLLCLVTGLLSRGERDILKSTLAQLLKRPGPELGPKDPTAGE